MVVIVVVVVVVSATCPPFCAVVATGASDSAATSFSTWSMVATALFSLTSFDGAMYSTIRHVLPNTRDLVIGKEFSIVPICVDNGINVLPKLEYLPFVLHFSSTFNEMANVSSTE